MSPRVADIRDVVMAALSAIAAAALIPMLPFVGVPAAAVALTYLRYRLGRSAQVIVALVSGVLASALFWTLDRDPLVALLVVPLVFVAGPVSGWLLERTTALRSVAVITALVLTLLLGHEIVQAAAQGKSLAAKLKADAAISRKVILETVRGGTPAETARYRRAADEAARQTLRQWPSTYAFVAGLTALLDVVAVGWVSRRAGGIAARLPAMVALDVSAHFVWPLIAGLAALAYASWSRSPDGLAGVIGLNLMLVVRPVMFLQGAGVAAAAYERAGMGKLARRLGVPALVMVEAFVPFPTVSALGTADLFLNFRKLDRGGSPPAENSDIGA